MQNFVPLTITAGLKIFPCISTDRVIGQVWTQTLSPIMYCNSLWFKNCKVTGLQRGKRRRPIRLWGSIYILFVLTDTVVLQGGGWQQGVVVWQRPGIEHVEARNERGWRAVHSLLLCRLHGLCRVQDGWGSVSVRTRQEWEPNTCRSPPGGRILSWNMSYFSSARALRAGLTERIPKTSSVSFSLKLSQSSYTCQHHEPFSFCLLSLLIMVVSHLKSRLRTKRFTWDKLSIEDW